MKELKVATHGQEGNEIFHIALANIAVLCSFAEESTWGGAIYLVGGTEVMAANKLKT